MKFLLVLLPHFRNHATGSRINGIDRANHQHHTARAHIRLCFETSARHEYTLVAPNPTCAEACKLLLSAVREMMCLIMSDSIEKEEKWKQF